MNVGFFFDTFYLNNNFDTELLNFKGNNYIGTTASCPKYTF